MESTCAWHVLYVLGCGHSDCVWRLLWCKFSFPRNEDSCPTITQTKSIDNNWSWRIPSLLQALPSIFCILVLLFIPESPRWLAYQDRYDDCLEVISVVNGLPIDHDVVQLQYREVIDTIDFEKSSGATLGPKELLKNAGNRKRLFCAASVAPLVMLTGSNIIT